MNSAPLIIAAGLLVRTAAAQPLANGGFEAVANGAAQAWHACGTYALEAQGARSGTAALRCALEDGAEASGVMQELVYARPDLTPVAFSGWSRSEGVAARDYCIYLDVWYEGGGNAWGLTASWLQGSHDWAFASELFVPEKPIAKLRCYVFLRGGTGRAWFDDIRLERRSEPFAVARHNPVADRFAVWTADAMRRVTPLTYPAEAELGAAEVALELARGECESAQLLVTASASCTLSNVTVELESLTGADGRRFDGDAFWQRVGYVRRQRPYHAHPCGPAVDETWLPDPLLPAAPFAVRSNATQAVWLTFRAGEKAAPGTYRGAALVKVGGRTARRVPVSLRVRDFALPKTFGLPTAFCVMDGFTRAMYPERFAEMRRKTHDLMLDHRLNPDDISRTEPPRIEELLHARERGMNRFNVLNLVPRSEQPAKWVCYAPLSAYTPAFYEALKARLTPVVAELKRHGLERQAYLYGFDERAHEYYPAIAALWRNLKADFPELPVMTTAMMYRDLRDGQSYPDQEITDWFCPLTSVYDPALSARLRAQGRQVWWYVCCGPTYPHANFASLEYPFIEGRLLAWLSYLYRSDGLLYWHVNLWPDGPPLSAGETFLDAWQAERSNRMPGDGQLLYPGADGPWPSIRLASIRDGVEDYEWLALLEQRKGRAAAEAVTARVVRSMTDFERDPLSLRHVRSALADALEHP